MNYKLTNNKIVFNGETLYQIECIRDCKWAKKGEIGGYIASLDNLVEDGWVNYDACVCDTSIVSGYIEEGFVAGNSVVEGKVKGIVVRDSYVDEKCDLEHVLVIKSGVYKSNYKSFKKENYPLTQLILVNSFVNKVEMYGDVQIINSRVHKTSVEWQHIEDKEEIEEGYLIELYDYDKETGEVFSRRVSDEKFVKVDEEIKRKFEEYAKSIEIEVTDDEEDVNDYDDIENLFKDRNGDYIVDYAKGHLDYMKNEKPLITASKRRELNKLGYVF
jgi:hypothetical protein